MLYGAQQLLKKIVCTYVSTKAIYFYIAKDKVHLEYGNKSTRIVVIQKSLSIILMRGYKIEYLIISLSLILCPQP